jgi:hypothetical protein
MCKWLSAYNNAEKRFYYSTFSYVNATDYLNSSDNNCLIMFPSILVDVTWSDTWERIINTFIHFLGMLEWVIGPLQVTVREGNMEIFLCPEYIWK